MASRRRQRAVRDALAGGAVPDDMTAEEFGAAAARHSSRQALQLARACFDNTISASAEQIAAKLVELAMDGSVPALLTVARSVVPPARFDSTMISLDVGRLETPQDVDAARRRLAEAVFSGRVGVEDAAGLSRLLDSIGEGMLRDAQTALLASMRQAVADSTTHSVGDRVAALARRAEAALRGVAAPEPMVIEAVPDEEPW